MKAVKKKLPTGIDEDFVKEVEAATPETLKAMVVRFQGYKQECRAFLTADLENLDEAQHAGALKIRDLKEDYDLAAAPTRESIKGADNKIKFVMESLRRNGSL